MRRAPLRESLSLPFTSLPSRTIVPTPSNPGLSRFQAQSAEPVHLGEERRECECPTMNRSHGNFDDNLVRRDLVAFQRTILDSQNLLSRPCSLWTIALNSRGIDTVSPCTPHPEQVSFHIGQKQLGFDTKRRPPLRRIRYSHVFAGTHPCLCKTAHLCLFLTKPWAHFRERFESRAPSGPARQKRRFRQDDLSGAAKVSFRTMRTVVGAQTEEIGLRFAWNRTVSCPPFGHPFVA